MKAALSLLIVFQFFAPPVRSAVYGDPSVFSAANGLFSGLLTALSSNDHITVVAENNSIGFFIAPGYNMPLSELFKSLLPGFSNEINTSSTNNPLVFPLSNFTVNPNTGEIRVGTHPLFTLSLLPESFIAVTNVTAMVGITVNKTVSKTTADITSFAISGEILIANYAFDVRAYIGSQEKSFYGAIRTKSMQSSQLMSSHGDNIFPSDFLKPAMQAIGLDDFELRNVYFMARSVESFGTAYGLHGEPVLSFGDYSAGLNVTILLHYRNKKAIITFLLHINSFQLAPFLKNLLNIDITNVPVLSSFTVPETSIIISTGNLAPNLLPTFVDPLSQRGGDISSGLTIAMSIPFQSVGTGSSSQQEVDFLLRVSKEAILFSLVDVGGALTFNNVIHQFFPNYDTNKFTEKLPAPLDTIAQELLDTILTNLEFQKGRSGVESHFLVNFEYKGIFELIPNFASIDHPQLSVKMVFGDDSKTTVALRGKWRIGNSNFNITLNPVQGGFEISARAQNLRIGEAIQHFGATFLPPPFDGLLSNLDITNFIIVEPELNVTKGPNTFQIVLAAELSFGDWGGAIVEGAIEKNGNKKTVLLGFDFSNFNFMKLLSSLTGLDISHTSLQAIMRDFACGVVISPRAVSVSKLKGPALSRIGAIPKGVTFAAFLVFPEICPSDDSFCTFVNNYLKGADLFIKGTLAGLTEIKLSVGAQNIVISSSLKIKSVSLDLALGTETYFQVAGALVVTTTGDYNNLEFDCYIRLGLKGLTLSVTMKGYWIPAFGLDFLGIGYVHAKIDFSPELGGFPGLDIGGSILLGSNPASSKAINITANVGFMPDYDYFQGSVNKLTFQSVLDAFEVNAEPPKVLGDTGFPDGLFASFATRDVVLPTGYTVKQGILVNGSLNILGFHISLFFQVCVTQFKVDAEMDPLNLANGLFVLQRSDVDDENGPKIKIDIDATVPSIDVFVSGYIKLLWGLASAEGKLIVTDFLFYCYLDVKLFSIFDFGLEISASYVTDLKLAAFVAKGEAQATALDDLSNDLNSKIHAEIGDIKDDLVDLKNIEAELSNRKFSTQKILQDLNADLEKAAADLEQLEVSLAVTRKLLKKTCTIKCPVICRGCNNFWTGKCSYLSGICLKSDTCCGWGFCCRYVFEENCYFGLLQCQNKRRENLQKEKEQQDDIKLKEDRIDHITKTTTRFQAELNDILANHKGNTQDMQDLRDRIGFQVRLAEEVLDGKYDVSEMLNMSFNHYLDDIPLTDGKLHFSFKAKILLITISFEFAIPTGSTDKEAQDLVTGQTMNKLKEMGYNIDDLRKRNDVEVDMIEYSNKFNQYPNFEKGEEQNY